MRVRTVQQSSRGYPLTTVRVLFFGTGASRSWASAAINTTVAKLGHEPTRMQPSRELAAAPSCRSRELASLVNLADIAYLSRSSRGRT